MLESGSRIQPRRLRSTDKYITLERQEQLIRLAQGGAPASAVRQAIRETVEAMNLQRWADSK